VDNVEDLITNITDTADVGLPYCAYVDCVEGDSIGRVWVKKGEG